MVDAGRLFRLDTLLCKCGGNHRNYDTIEYQ